MCAKLIFSVARSGFQTTLMDEEVDDCLCDHPEICTCVFEMDWMKELLVPIAKEGYQHGFGDGVDAAVHDTIYAQPFLGSHDLSEYVLPPDYAYVDPCRYQRAYRDGFQYAYTNVYRRHDTLLKEVRLRHTFQAYMIYLLLHFQFHPLLDLNLLKKIESYLWSKPVKKIKPDL
jgi:hypothetical protein